MSLFEELEAELLAKNYRYTPTPPGGQESDIHIAFKFVCRKLEEVLVRVEAIENTVKATSTDNGG